MNRKHYMKKTLSFIVACMFSLQAYAETTREIKTEHYFATIKSDPNKEHSFLLAMPKGGDLHNHESGSSFPQNVLRYGYHDNLCVDPTNFVVSINPTCSTSNLLDNAIKQTSFRNALLDAWSMRDFIPGKETGHNHFFATFGKDGAITNVHRGEILAEIAKRAAAENEQYLELMVTIDGNESGFLGRQIGWNPNFKVMREKLLTANMNKIISAAQHNLSADEAKKNTILDCKANPKNKGCDVTIKYLYQVLREQSPEMVFAQLLAGFELASHDPRVVGVNMVQPEDGPISMRDYKLHMQMVGYLHQLYPQVHISLHAGELTNALVSAEGLKFHIHDAVEVAHAERIGHGVDIAQEDQSEQLLKTMAAKHVLVEINLSSNEEILNVSGASHPLPLYLQYNVPTTLSTDDEGVSLKDMVAQYEKAEHDFHFDYLTLKNFARNSLFYAFLSGKNLWRDYHYQHVATPCATDSFASLALSNSCRAFLAANEKANLQWELEHRFTQFEDRFS